MDDGCNENIANRRNKVESDEGTKNPRETVSYPHLFICLWGKHFLTCRFPIASILFSFTFSTLSPFLFPHSTIPHSLHFFCYMCIVYIHIHNYNFLHAHICYRSLCRLCNSTSYSLSFFFFFENY